MTALHADSPKAAAQRETQSSDDGRPARGEYQEPTQGRPETCSVRAAGMLSSVAMRRACGAVVRSAAVATAAMLGRGNTRSAASK